VRIHIIGMASAGKTTLATQLAQRLDVPVYVLDQLAFVDDRWTLRAASERDEMLTGILEQPGFVTEGGFLGWTEDLLAAADVVLWLDPPLRTLVWRHIRRFGRHPLWLPGLLRFQIESYIRPEGAGPAKDDPNLTRAGQARALKPWCDKVFRARRGVTADQVLRSLAALD
jgi:hypothetical protein